MNTSNQQFSSASEITYTLYDFALCVALASAANSLLTQQLRGHGPRNKNLVVSVVQFSGFLMHFKELPGSMQCVFASVDASRTKGERQSQSSDDHGQ